METKRLLEHLAAEALLRLSRLPHSAATLINAVTGNLKLTQKFLGHSEVSSTADIYTHTSVGMERDAAAALEKAIFGDLFPMVPNWELGTTLQ